jgi:hypothetical protein
VKKKVVWQEPTRRSFVAMIGAAAAALALAKVKLDEPPPPPLPRWIGHI